jgi:hypothetical protein
MACTDVVQGRPECPYGADGLYACHFTIPNRRKFLRLMAGFQPQTVGNSYLPRAKVHPLGALIRALSLTTLQSATWWDY